MFPNHPEYAHPRKPESESNEPADSKEKGPTVFDRQAFSSVGVTGFEPATTRPPDVYSKTEYSTYFQRIILLPNVAVDFSVDLTVKG